VANQEPIGPFVLRIATLESGETRLELSGTPSELDIDPAFVRVAGRITAHLRIYRAGDKIEVQGEVGAPVDLACDRCLAPVRRPIRAPIRVYAERRESRDRRPVEEVREDDLGIVYHDGRFLDLTEEVRQVFLVEVPWHILCRDECRGLCPRCGADLNPGPCGCAPQAADPRWEGLAAGQTASAETEQDAPGTATGPGVNEGPERG